MQNVETHPFEPYIVEGSNKLIIGTIPPPRFSKQELQDSDVNFYYGSSDNQFWDIMGDVCNVEFTKENTQKAIEERKKALSDMKLSICDIIKQTKRKNNSALDKYLDPVEYLNILELLEKNPKIDTLIYTSTENGVKTFMTQYLREKFSKEVCHITVDKSKKHFKLLNKYDVYIVDSPSRRNTKSIKNKAETYKEVLTN